MIQDLDNRFYAIILKCQLLKTQFGFDYKEKCSRQIDKYSKEIASKNLIQKCADKDFAKQLCIANCLEVN